MKQNKAKNIGKTNKEKENVQNETITIGKTNKEKEKCSNKSEIDQMFK